jgi:hypothetical protein
MLRAASHYLYLPDAQGTAAPVPPEQQLAAEAADFPSMCAAGFNAVLLVEFRSKFDAPDGLTNLRMELETARQNGMHVLMGLNYDDFQIAASSSSYDIEVEQVRFASWLSFIVQLLAGIEDYADVVYPFVFEEGCIPPTLNWEMQHHWIASRLRATIGNTPALLPSALRTKFSLGWYGAWSSLWDASATGGFDWVGTGRFYFDPSNGLPRADKGLTDAEILADLTQQFDRLQTLYPGLPAVLVEGGYCTCDSSSLVRAGEVYALLVRFCRSNGFGWNLWGYRTLLSPEEECAARSGRGGHSLTNPDGSPRPALLAVEEAMRERIPPRHPPFQGHAPRTLAR